MKLNGVWTLLWLWFMLGNTYDHEKLHELGHRSLPIKFHRTHNHSPTINTRLAITAARETPFADSRSPHRYACPCYYKGHDQNRPYWQSFHYDHRFPIPSLKSDSNENHVSLIWLDTRALLKTDPYLRQGTPTITEQIPNDQAIYT
jgi:hypothetical protein